MVFSRVVSLSLRCAAPPSAMICMRHESLSSSGLLGAASEWFRRMKRRNTRTAKWAKKEKMENAFFPFPLSQLYCNAKIASLIFQPPLMIYVFRFRSEGPEFLFNLTAARGSLSTESHKRDFNMLRELAAAADHAT